MGKMKELAIQLANENHGSWEQQLTDEHLDDDYWQEFCEREKAYVAGGVELDLTKSIDKRIHKKYESTRD
tara:strand:+ start:267 stop:476 length:210 start_codon:yes stop_codon:yes gene_type:complete